MPLWHYPASPNGLVGLNTDGALAGLGHPFSGRDHILAMVAAAFWVATLGGKARWTVPSIFVGLMPAGSAMGITGLASLLVETSIALTVAVLRLLGALEVKVPTAVVASARFPMATSMAASDNGARGTYVAGCLAATIALHTVSIGLAQVRQKPGRPRCASPAGPSPLQVRLQG